MFVCLSLLPVFAQEVEQALEKELADAIQSIAEDLKGKNIDKLALDQIVYENTEMAGEMAAQISQVIEAALQGKGISVVREIGSQDRSMTLKPVYHTLEARYEVREKNLRVVVALKNPSGTKVKEKTVVVKNITPKCQADLLPANHEVVQKTLAAFEPPKSDYQRETVLSPQKKLTVHITTVKCKTAAIYKHGELLQLLVQASADCYLHLYYVQSDGKILRIFPNKFHKESRIDGRVVYEIPSPKDPKFQFRVNAQTTKGMEVIKAIASLDPLPEVEAKAIVFDMRALDIEPAGLMEAVHKKVVAEDSCSILVVEK
jgi:hypothetical protein